jgi:acyl dehydratase
MQFAPDLALPAGVTTGARAISMHDIEEFARVCNDWAPIHTDPVFARDGVFGGVVAHATLVLSVAYGLMVGEGVFEDALAWLELRWTMKAPVRPGDSVRVTITPLGVRRSKSQDERCIATFDVVVSNQHGDLVAVGQSVHLFPLQDPSL